MKIQAAQNYQLQKQTPQFKSAYPVIHWVKETNGSYAPAISNELNEKLQRILVRLLNNQGKKVKPNKIQFMQYIQSVIASKDSDYAENRIVRSFYDHDGGGWIQDKFAPYGYILSGKHAEHMSETLGKPIGRAKGEAPRINDSLMKTAEVSIAVGDYKQQGLTLVKRLASKFKDSKKICQGLHTKFEIIRTKTGKIKEFRLLDIRFCPEEGPENPFVRTGLYKS